MTDWATISSLATAGGTLVLAIATFSSVRSANRAARTAERALSVGLRPVLTGSRLDDPVQKVGFGDEHWIRVEGGRAGIELEGDVIYMVMPVRNVGRGIAVIQAWWPWGAWQDNTVPPEDPTRFRLQSRDLYVPPNDVSFWQGAIRSRDDPHFERVADAIKERRRMTLDLLYSDHEGGQRTISRFILTPIGDSTSWLADVGRHWSLDRPNPRP